METQETDDNSLQQARVVVAGVVTTGQLLDILQPAQNLEGLCMRYEKKKIH